MDIMKSLIEQMGGVDLSSIGEKLGMSPEEVQNGATALLSQLSGGGTTAQAAMGAAASTGIDLTKLEALLPMLTSAIGDANLGGDGILGKLGGMLDRDGDGNPVDDVLGMAKGLFGKS